MNTLQRLERAEIEKMNKKEIASFRPGDTVQVHCNVVEGNKRRIQVFEGTVMYRKGTGLNENVCVRKIGAGGIGVERVFPLYSPTVDKITRTRQGRVRRARLFYLRDRVGKSARVREISAASKAALVAQAEARALKDKVRKGKKRKGKGKKGMPAEAAAPEAPATGVTPGTEANADAQE